MASDAVLNIRLPKELKDQGNQVLKKNHATVSGLVRRLYEYLEKEQRIPDCLMAKDQTPLSMERRRLLRSVAGSVQPPQGLSLEQVRDAYRDEKYGAGL